jgi:hypothetical protein
MIVKTEHNYKWFALSCTTLGALLSVIDGTVLAITRKDLRRSAVRRERLNQVPGLNYQHLERGGGGDLSEGIEA